VGLKRRAAQLGLGDRLYFAGQREDVPRLMAACDVVCHATRVPEPFGMVLIEAMAQSRPVIATRGGGPSEVVEDGATGLLVPPDDAPAMADAMRLLAADPKRRCAMGEAGLQRVKARFSSEAMASRLLQALDTLR
jgi:glycosyltransferase involved in cell wall biosynthesis